MKIQDWAPEQLKYMKVITLINHAQNCASGHVKSWAQRLGEVPRAASFGHSFIFKQQSFESITPGLFSPIYKLAMVGPSE